MLTTRRESINQLTKEWLDKYYPEIFSDYIFSGFFDVHNKESINMTKGELAKNINADFLIDDQLKHVQSAASMGIKGLLFGDYTWNKIDKLPKNVTRVKDWKEVDQFFHSLFDDK